MVVMTSLRVLVLLVAVLFNGAATARDDSCSALPKIFPPILPVGSCQCGKALANAKLTPPKGLRLVAACRLTWDHEKNIDLTTAPVELNGYTQGDYPLGTLYLAGPIELRGKVRVTQEEDSEGVHDPEATFIVKWPAAERPTEFLRMISGLSFQDMATEKALHIDRALSGNWAGKRCAVAAARIRVQGVILTNDDSDAQGTYAVGTRVLEISRYRTCPAEGPLADRTSPGRN
jgi:hypothetical protein